MSDVLDIQDEQLNLLGEAQEAPETEEQTIQRLAKMPLIEYERCRTEEAKKLGIKRLPILDKLVEAERKELQPNDGKAGSAINFEDVEPCQESVDSTVLMDDLIKTIHRFVICDHHTAIATALWCCMTWLMDYVHTAPIANISAPEKNCGKSVMLETIGMLVPRPMNTSNISSSALFRIIEQSRPTLLVDEADAFMDENEEIRSVLNAGHKRKNAYVVRVVGDDHEPRQFCVWGAKVIAGIGKRAGTIESRSIQLRLRRKLPNERTERLRGYEVEQHFLSLRSKLARLAEDIAQIILRATPVIPSELQNRDADNWEPLLAIADAIGGEWPQKARLAAITLCGVQEGETIEQELLADIKDVFDAKGVNRLFTADILQALNEDEEKAWATYNRGKPLTAKQLANRLKGYGIKSHQTRIGDVNKNGFDRKDFEDTFNRYLSSSTPSLSSTTLQTASDKAYEGNLSSTENGNVEDRKTLQATQDKGCRVVEDKKLNFENVRVSL